MHGHGKSGQHYSLSKPDQEARILKYLLPFNATGRLPHGKLFNRLVIPNPEPRGKFRCYSAPLKGDWLSSINDNPIRLKLTSWNLNHRGFLYLLDLGLY